MEVSHPSDCLLPLQSAQPAAHVPLHEPAVHVAVMWFEEQTTPQAPQLLTEYTEVSHPSDFLSALQSAQPAVHVPLHEPAVHVAVMLFEEQTTPQAPQLLTE